MNTVMWYGVLFLIQAISSASHINMEDIKIEVFVSSAQYATFSVKGDENYGSLYQNKKFIGAYEQSQRFSQLYFAYNKKNTPNEMTRINLDKLLLHLPSYRNITYVSIPFDFSRITEEDMRDREYTNSVGKNIVSLDDTAQGNAVLVSSSNNDSKNKWILERYNDSLVLSSETANLVLMLYF